MKYMTSILNFFLVFLLLVSQPVRAENKALMELLKALHNNGTIDAQTYQLVKQVAQSESETEAQTVRSITREEVEKTADKVVEEKVKLAKKEDKPGDLVRLGGRLQVDAATYREDGSRHNDGTEIRRARLFAEGDLGEAWGYKLQYDFTADGIEGIQDAYLDYKGFESFKIRTGHFKEPFSLQNMTSSKYVLFMERGLPYLFAEGRNLGIQLATNGKNWTAAGGAFGDGRDGEEDDNDEGYGVSGRVTYAPLYENDRFLHLGASASYRSTGSKNELRFRERPESHLTDTRLVDTGTFDADNYGRVVGEAAFIYGPFHVQGEYYHTSIDRDIDANPDLDFSGYYVEGGWMLTGESMNYKPNKGSYSKVTPKAPVGKGGIGAWQLAMRFSSLDLTDEDIMGGEEENFTIGLNWYATPNIRFIANYVNVLDVFNGANEDDEPEVFQLRSQIEF